MQFFSLFQIKDSNVSIQKYDKKCLRVGARFSDFTKLFFYTVKL